jgi:DNA-binding transcriptional ArsR family regulator
MTSMAKPPLKLPACTPKAPLSERPLLGLALASELAQVFEVLASDTRLRLLHALVILGDPCMSDLAEAVGMKPQAVSNQLRRLVDLGILGTRRHGTHIHYNIVDPCVIRLMHHGLCLNEETRDHLRVNIS